MNQAINGFLDFVDKNNWVFLIPTILFALIIILSMLLGMKRGAVKSTHKFMIMAVSLGSAIGLFYLLTANNGAMLYSISSSIMSMFNQSFESLLHVKPTSPDMYGVVYPFVLDFVTNKFGGPENMAIEIYAQIDVWTQMATKIIVFVLCIVIFTILSLILNIFDWILFRKRKRVKKARKLRIKYRNHSFIGGIVGAMHGLVTCLFMFSFIGFTFYAIGAGDREENRLSFTDESMSNIYEVTNFTNKLGDSGVLKFLNQYKDDNNMPFYLFFANEIFSGNAKDYDGNEYKVYVSKELRSYTKLARDLMDLLAKHGGKELSLEVLSNTNPEQTYEVLNNLFTNEAFKKDLIEIIDKYQATEYLKNITKVSISMVGKYYEEIFTKLSATPEKYITMFDAIFSNELDPYYIAVEDIVTYEDTKTLLKGVLNTVPKILEMLEFTSTNKELQVSSPKLYSLNMVNYSLEAFNEIVPTLNELSMFKDSPVDTKEVKLSKIDKMNKLYDRCVDFAFNVFKNKLGKPIDNPYLGHNIKWNHEFFNLTSAISDITKLTNEVVEYNSDNIDLSALEVVNDIFSKNYTNKSVIDNAYFGLADKANNFESVRILLDSEFFYTTYESLLSKIAKAEVQIPRNINWVNTESGDGELTKSLIILREILAEETLKPYLKDPKLSDLNTLKEMVLKLESPYKNTTLLEYMFESDVLYYTSSAIMSNMKMSTFQMVIPDNCKEDINGVMVTKKADLINTFKVLPTILKEIEDLNAIKNDPLSLIEVVSKVSIKDSVINSDILTATMSQTVYNMTATDPNISKFLVVPLHLALDGTDPKALDRWLGNNGELDKMLSTLPLIDIKGVINNDKSAIVKILNCNETDFNTLIGSDVLYFTINKLITTLNNPNFTIFVPSESVEVFTLPVAKLTTETQNEVKVIKKDELYKMVHGASKIISVDAETNELVFAFNNVITCKDDVLASNILYASLANKIIDIHNTQTTKNLYLPSTFVTADLNNISSSAWRQYKELESLLETLAVLGINLDDIVKGGFNPSDLTKQLLTLDEIYKDNRTKVEVLYDSSIIALTLSETLKNQEALKGKIFIPTSVNVPLKSSTEEIITPTEWVKLISGVKKAFGLNANDDLISQFTDFTNLIANFFNPLTYEEGKMALFESYILEDTLVHQLLDALTNKTNNAVVVPTMLTLDNNKMWYNDRTNPDNQGELCHMLDVLHITGVGKMFSDPNFSQVLEKALELSGIIYTQDDALADGTGNTILLEKQHKQEQLLRSQVICATIIDKLSTLEFINVPKSYKFTNIKDEYNMDNIWYTSNELVHMFNSINELKLPISGTQITFDVNCMLTNNYNLVNICKSKVMHTTLSTKLVDSTYNTLVIPYKLYNLDAVTGERVLDASEIDLLINSFKALGLSAFGSEITVPQASQVMKACESSIIRATLSNKILLALKQARFLEDPQRPLESFTRITTGLVESLEQYSVFNNEDIKEFVEVLNSNTQSSNGFEFKITSIDDISKLDSTVFNSRIALSVINNYVLSNQTITQSFVYLMIKKTNNPQYTISNHLVTEVTETGFVTTTDKYITKEELLTFKNTPVNPNAPVIPNVPETPNVPEIPNVPVI